MPKNLIQELFPIPTAASDGNNKAGKLAAFRAHLIRWRQRRDQAKTDFHRKRAADEIDYYKSVITAIEEGQEAPGRPPSPARVKTWSLYRHYDESGQLLYVGSSGDWLARTDRHRRAAPWWGEVVKITIAHFPTSDEMSKAEKEAVAKEEPLWNQLLQRPKSEFIQRRFF